jgi:hypothetical protein
MRVSPAKVVCTICRHAERAKIERLRAGGASYLSLGRRFGVSMYAVHRHWRNHVSPQRRAALIVGPAKIEALAGQAADESRSLIEDLALAKSVLFRSFLDAAELKDRHGVATVAGRLLECLKALGALTGQLREASKAVGASVSVVNTVNIIGSPEFVALQSGLLRIARAHPTAKADIVSLLRSLDDRPIANKPNGQAHAGPLIEGEASHVA